MSSAAKWLAAALLLIGCPTPVDVEAARAKPAAPSIEEDPRVVRDGEDLYAADVIEKRQHQEEAAQPVTGLGSGKPDESNGKCRLFAPELPKPECCEGEYGFDADVLQQTCGFELYLGESFQYSCGYYFLRPGSLPSWFRMTFIAGETPQATADVHDQKLRRVAKNESLKSTPVPGVDGALWSTHDGLRWAFLPGWKRVRQLSWKQSECSDEAMAKVIAQIVAAQEPPPGTERSGLVPKARGKS
ncbi:MAG TPA: hypothetical protein VG755_13190 [Nannocystaceae bacterium]|nr:hypothetical protein [Nannocystaceae bacterium]